LWHGNVQERTLEVVRSLLQFKHWQVYFLLPETADGWLMYCFSRWDHPCGLQFSFRSGRLARQDGNQIERRIIV
jgi:hypothetical protein